MENTRSDTARELAFYRILAVLAGILIPVFGFIQQWNRPENVDLLPLRLGFSAACWLFLFGSYFSSFFRERISLFALPIYYLITLYSFFLLHLNRLTYDYLVGHLLAYLAVSVVLRTGRQVIQYNIFNFAGAALVAILTQAELPRGRFFLAAFVTLASIVFLAQYAWLRVQADRDRALRALHESDARYRTLFENAPEAIVVLNVHTRKFVDVNPNAEALFKMNRRDLLECGPVELSPPEQPGGEKSVDAAGGYIGECVAGGQPVFEWLHRDSTGREIPCEVRLVLLPAEKETLVRGSITDITARRAAQERIRHMAYHDPLTGLPNRKLLLDRMELEIAHARRDRTSLAVLYLDLDRMKNINDSLGHSAGDWVLQRVSRRLKDALRDSDTVARHGGDEFIILLPGLQDLNGPRQVAEKILNEMGAPLFFAMQEIRLTASIGIALFPRDGETPESLISNADMAMYWAKQKGRNGFEYYLESQDTRSEEKLKLEGLLHHALAQGEFYLHYQPRVRAESPTVTGMEVLIRWNHPERGPVSPMEFIPLAEETGLIVPIGEWVLETVCRAQARIRDEARLDDLFLSLNLSPRQFQLIDLSQRFKAIVGATGARADRLEIEITEGTLIQDVVAAERTMNELVELGFEISIDDFGTGYSSLAYLKRFPVRVLKVDRTFIHGLLDDPDSTAIVKAIIELGRNLNLRTVAEGVETEEQYARLRELGCDEFQGYYFGRPAPLEEALENLRTREVLK